MSDKPISDLRARMIADMTIRTFGEKTRHDYIRHVEAFARFLGRSSDTATGDDIRRFQLAQVEQGAQPPKMNTQASALRFLLHRHARPRRPRPSTGPHALRLTVARQVKTIRQQVRAMRRRRPGFDLGGETIDKAVWFASLAGIERRYRIMIEYGLPKACAAAVLWRRFPAVRVLSPPLKPNFDAAEEAPLPHVYFIDPDITPSASRLVARLSRLGRRRSSSSARSFTAGELLAWALVAAAVHGVLALRRSSPVPISVASFASDFDPSSGLVANQNLVRVAVVREPGEAIPLQNRWIGAAEDHLSMNVAVRVTAADAGAELGGSTDDDDGP